MLKIKTLLTVTLLLAVFGLGISAKVLADTPTCVIGQANTTPGGDPVACTCPTGYAHPKDDSGDPVTNVCRIQQTTNSCASGNVDTKDSTKCVPLGSGCGKTDPNDPAAVNKCLQNNSFVKDLNNIVNFLSAAVGIVVIIVIIIGGIQYSLAGDNANAQGEARKRITNGLLALVAFIFTYAFLQWLIPGGI